MAKTTSIDFSSDNFSDCNQKLAKQVTEIDNAESDISRIRTAEYGSSYPDANVSTTLNALYNEFSCKREINVNREIEIGKKRATISNIENTATSSLSEQNNDIVNYSTAINFLFGDLINVSGNVTVGLAQAVVNCMNKSEYMLYTYEEIVVFEMALNTEATSLTREEKQILIDAFERVHPEYASDMNSTLSIFGDENYYDHILNIKVLAYTANEPYRTLFLENIGEVRILTLHEGGTQNFTTGGETGEYGISINVDKMSLSSAGDGRAEARVYNTFFHECGHNIDYLIGLQSNSNRSFTRTYVDDNEVSLSNALENDVRRRIDEAIGDYLDPMIGLPQNVRDDVRIHVVDAIMNQIDARTYGKPDFNNEYGYMTSICYDYVCDTINNQLYGSARDNYGAFTGNTLSGTSNGGFHPAMARRVVDNPGVDNDVYSYGFYWIDGDYSEITVDENDEPTAFIITTDNGEVFTETQSLLDPNLTNGVSFAEQIIYSDGNLVYNNSSGSEFFAETMAVNMTRETVNSREMDAWNYYYDETTDYFDIMIDEMLEYS